MNSSKGKPLRAVVSRRGAERWQHGHPWIYASDVADAPDLIGGIAAWEAAKQAVLT